MPRWKANLALALNTLIWGSTFVLVKDALDAVGPLTFVAWRFILASAAMALLFPRRLCALTRRDLRAGMFVGVWLTGGFIFQTIGLQYTSSGKAGFITGLSVVIVPVLATVLLRRPPGRGAVMGVSVATVGLGLLSLNFGEGLRVASGDVWVLLCAVVFAMHIVSVAHYAPHHDTIRLTTVQIATAAVLTTALAFLFETPKLDLPPAVWGAIAFNGVVATAFVFSIQVYVQRFTTSTHTALIFSLEPVFAAFFGWWWAGELLGPKEIAGCGLILLGMVFAETDDSDGAESGR